MNRTIPSFLIENPGPSGNQNISAGKLKVAFIDQTLKRSAEFIRNAITQYEKRKDSAGFSSISAQSLLVFFLTYIVCINLTSSISGQLIFTGLLFFLALLAPVKMKSIYRSVFLLSFFFGFLVMLPAAMNVFTPGRIVLTIFRFQSSKTVLIYHIPSQIGITDAGITIVMRMFVKVMNSLTLTFVILQSTSFYRLIKALRIVRVPPLFILIITLSYKFIFVLSQTVEEMYLALRARWIGSKDQKETRRIIAGRIGFLFRKSWVRYENIYKAMTARGFTGEISISGRENMTWKEASILLILASLGIVITIFLRK
jgi:cobalt/nickel transport system permease protein